MNMEFISGFDFSFASFDFIHVEACNFEVYYNLGSFWGVYIRLYVISFLRRNTNICTVLPVDGRLAPRDPLIHGYPWIGLN